MDVEIMRSFPIPLKLEREIPRCNWVLPQEKFYNGFNLYPREHPWPLSTFAFEVSSMGNLNKKHPGNAIVQIPESSTIVLQILEMNEELGVFFDELIFFFVGFFRF
ncbi:hypothetical protein TNCV_1623721 [Trichonephila clavipes]|nr:hypothetical protein TNCV_1623721 [Trichonephila clavipes]